MQVDQERRNVVCVSTYSRTNLLRDCLTSIVTARNNSDLILLVVQQDNEPGVTAVISEFSKDIDVLIHTSGEGRTPLQNINFNRILCYEYGFNLLNADFIIAIEDDCIISKDAIQFIESVYANHEADSKFRGINLGSKESECSTFTYSCLRYGLMGQAGVITQKTWNHFRIKRLKSLATRIPFDAIIEPYLKTGYMVTPNRSRMVDRGWDGTHFHTDADDPHFQAINSSWHEGVNKMPATVFKLENVAHSWRNDAVVFQRKDQPKYFLKLIFANLRTYPQALFLINIFRRMLKLSKYS